MAFFLLIIFSQSKSQSFNPIDYSYSYEGILNKSTSEFLMSVSNNLRKSDENITTADSTTNILSYETFFLVRTAQGGSLAKKKGKVSYKIKIDCSNRNYSVRISDFVHTSAKKHDSGGSLSHDLPDCGRMYLSEDDWRQLKDQTKDRALITINQIKNLAQ